MQSGYTSAWQRFSHARIVCSSLRAILAISGTSMRCSPANNTLRARLCSEIMGRAVQSIKFDDRPGPSSGT